MFVELPVGRVKRLHIQRMHIFLDRNLELPYVAIHTEPTGTWQRLLNVH